MGKKKCGHITKEDTQKANKRMKRGSASHVIGKLEIKTTIRQPRGPSRSASCWREYGARRMCVHRWWGCEMVPQLGRCCDSSSQS